MNEKIVLHCLSGPLRGKTWMIGPDGLQFGRDADCGVRFSNDSMTVSRHHCMLRWQQGLLVMVDFGSRNGTWHVDDSPFPPYYPMTVLPGSQFYLADSTNLFQVELLKQTANTEEIAYGCYQQTGAVPQRTLLQRRDS